MIRRPGSRRRGSTPVVPSAAPSPTVPAATPRTITIIDDELDTVVVGASDDPGEGPDAAPARTAMDPRIRARRREVRRTLGRRRRRVLGLGLAVVLVLAIALVLFASPVLSVRRVEVDGAAYSRYFDGPRLDAVVASLRGQPILSVDLDAARRELEASPWVRRARVVRDLPSRIIVELEERRPLVWFRGADGWHRVIDVDGVVVAVLEGQPVDYLGVAGTAPDVEPGDTAPPIFQAVAQLVRSLPSEVARLATGLAVSDTGDVSMTLVSGTEVRFGRPDDLQGKLVGLVVVLRRNDVAELTTIDLSSGQPTVR